MYINKFYCQNITMSNKTYHVKIKSQGENMAGILNIQLKQSGKKILI